MDISLNYDSDFTVYVHRVPADAKLPDGVVKSYDDNEFTAYAMKLGAIQMKFFVKKEDGKDATT